MRIIRDTMKGPNGKWSRKSLTAFMAFNCAIAYELVLPFYGMVTKEYVFITLMALCGSVLGLTVWDKKTRDV